MKEYAIFAFVCALVLLGCFLILEALERQMVKEVACMDLGMIYIEKDNACVNGTRPWEKD